MSDSDLDEYFGGEEWRSLPPETTARDLSAIGAILENELPTNPDDTDLLRRALKAGAEGRVLSEAIHSGNHFKLGLLVEEARDRSLEALRECLLLEVVTAVYAMSRSPFSEPSARSVAASEVSRLLQRAFDEARKHFEAAVRDTKFTLRAVVEDLCEERAFAPDSDSDSDSEK